MATSWSCVAFGQQVAGDLLDDELVVGQVAVERVDDPVAIEPDAARLVLLEAVGVGVAGGVEPVPAPALAVVRRGEQPLDQLLVGVRRCRRRGTRRPPRASAAGRSGRGYSRRSSVTLSASGDGVSPSFSSRARTKRVDRRLRPGGVRHRRQRRADRRLEGPVILAPLEDGGGNLLGLGRVRRLGAGVGVHERHAGGILRAGVDPRTQQADLLRASTAGPPSSGGICRSGTRPATRRISGLLSLWPATKTFSFSSPPRRSPACVSRRKSLFCRFSPWQRTQLASRIGLMSLSKS